MYCVKTARSVLAFYERGNLKLYILVNEDATALSIGTFSAFGWTRKLATFVACALLTAVSANLHAWAAPSEAPSLKPIAPQIDPNADQGHRSKPNKPLQAGIQHNESLGKPKPRPPMRAAVTGGGLFGRDARLAPGESLGGRANDQNFAMQATSGFGIIGVKFVLVAGHPPVINRVFAGTPAAKVGLQNDDVIVAVDGVPTVGLTKEEVYDLIIGSPGTDVSMSIVRGGNVNVVNCTRMDINELVDPIVRRDYMLNM
jgi:hypothetical protein